MILARQAAYTMLFVAFWMIVELLGAHLQKTYSGYQIVWTRYVVHLAFMLAVWGRMRPLALLHTRRPVFQMARSLLMVVMPAAWLVSLSRGVAPQTMGACLLLTPLLVLLAATIALGERPSRTNWSVAVVLAVAAGIFALLGDVPAMTLAFPLAVAVSLGLYIAMTRSLRDEGTLTNLFYTALGVALVLTPLMPRIWVWPGLHDWLVLAAIGLAGFASLLALDRATATAPASSLGPVLGALFAVSLLIDLLSVRLMAGGTALAALSGALVIACVLLWRRRQAAVRRIA